MDELTTRFLDAMQGVFDAYPPDYHALRGAREAMPKARAGDREALRELVGHSTVTYGDALRLGAQVRRHKGWG